VIATAIFCGLWAVAVPGGGEAAETSELQCQTSISACLVNCFSAL